MDSFSSKGGEKSPAVISHSLLAWLCEDVGQKVQAHQNWSCLLAQVMVSKDSYGKASLEEEQMKETAKW